ncbi:MAG TPA: dihydroneopterin aldolase [Verrucomicrobia bacterium]|nr:dihydroneopterin aldolase [Verrucomicrobiota bacterium]
MSEKIYIRDLRVTCIIGINPRERVDPQDILINIMMECDVADACASDAIADTIDYKTLKDELVGFVSGSSFFLIERLADQVAVRCLAYARVKRVCVGVDKPGALTGARSVAVEVERCRD